MALIDDALLAIESLIKANGRREITGPILASVLKLILASASSVDDIAQSIIEGTAFYGVPEQATGVDNDSYLLVKDRGGKGLFVSVDDFVTLLKNYIEVTGSEEPPIQGGATESTALVVPAGPSGQVRTADVVSGLWYNFGSGPVLADENFRWRSYWSGLSWSLVRMGPLPDNSAKLPNYLEKSYKKDEVVFNTALGVYFRALRATSAPAGYDSVDWEIFVPSSDIVSNVYVEAGYVEKNTGIVVPSGDHTATVFLRIDRAKPIIVTGYSGRDDLAALASFYDADRNYISSYNPSTHQGWVSNHTIPTASIPANAVYAKFTKHVNQVASLRGAIDLSFRPKFWQTYIDTTANSLKISQTALAGRNLDNFFAIQGYVEKGNGSIVFDSSLRSSTYLRLNKAEPLIVTGYSGANDSAALVGFYDSSMNFVGSYNPTAGGLVTGLTVPAASIPSTATYARFTRSSGQTTPNPISSGVVRYLSDLDMLRVVEGNISKLNYVDSRSGYFNIQGYIDKRNGRPVPDAGFVHTRFVKIVPTNPLTISGYSGRDDLAALASFYDINFNHLVSVNAETYGVVENYIVAASKIPTNAYYVRVTATSVHASRRVVGTGVDITAVFNNAIQYTDFVNRKLNELSSDVKLPFNDTVRIKNYLGNFQNIHPKVLYFDTPLWGYRYWMAYTPFPFEFDQQENPCIAVSNNGIDWEVPQGLVNPLATPPPSSGYNSDTHLVYRADTKTLECWYRPVQSTGVASLVRRTTLDGVNWTPAETISGIDGVLSPSIIFEDGKYKLWYPNITSNINYVESATGVPSGWTTPVTIPIGNGVIAWHMDVVKSSRGTEYLIQGWEVGEGDNFTSSMFYKKDTSPAVKILSVENLPAYRKGLYNGLYRGSFIYVNGSYMVYYSYIRNDRYQGMVLAVGSDMRRLLPYNANLSPESSVVELNKNRDIPSLYVHSANTIHVKDSTVTIRALTGMRPNGVIDIVVTGSGQCTLVAGNGINEGAVITQSNSPYRIIATSVDTCIGI